jgi:hypothetical protein
MALTAYETAWLSAGYPNHAGHTQVSIPALGFANEYGCGCGNVLDLISPSQQELQALDQSAHTQAHAGHSKMRLPASVLLGYCFCCSCGTRLYLNPVAQAVASLGAPPAIQHPLHPNIRVREVATGKVFKVLHHSNQLPLLVYYLEEDVPGSKTNLPSKRVLQLDIDSGAYVVVP